MTTMTTILIIAFTALWLAIINQLFNLFFLDAVKKYWQQANRTYYTNGTTFANY